MTDLGVENANGINGSGQIAGSNGSHAILYSRGMITDLGTLGGRNSYGNAINDSGQVAGTSYIANNTNLHAFLYSGGRMIDLGTLGEDSYANAINSSGQV
jgi:probable HAF family extracellular repeat protein